MNSHRHSVAWMLCLLLLAGCASTKVTARNEYRGEPLPRPGRILVYDFGFTPDQIPPESPIANQITVPETPPTPEQIDVGRQLGAEVAARLADDIAEMGLPGVRAFNQLPPRPGDIVLHGYFLSMEEGSALKRIVIGFGVGAASLKTFVEGYQMSEYGLRPLGTAEITSGARGGSPGAFIPIAVTIATANPIGLIVGGTVKAVGEIAGTQKIQAYGKRTADEIAEQLRPKFAQQGWIAAN
jgi:hypothetical protein